MTTMWMTSDIARHIGRSTQSVGLYVRGRGVHTPPPHVAQLSSGVRLYDPDEIDKWWADELAHRSDHA